MTSSFGADPTQFNSGAFTAGAVGGALTIGGALAAGLANYAAAMEADWSHKNAEQLRALLRWSELARARDQIRLGREIQRLRDQVERYRRDVVINEARKLPH